MRTVDLREHEGESLWIMHTCCRAVRWGVVDELDRTVMITWGKFGKGEIVHQDVDELFEYFFTEGDNDFELISKTDDEMDQGGGLTAVCRTIPANSVLVALKQNDPLYPLLDISFCGYSYTPVCQIADRDYPEGKCETIDVTAYAHPWGRVIKYDDFFFSVFPASYIGGIMDMLAAEDRAEQESWADR